MKSGATQISIEPLHTPPSIPHASSDPIVAEFREKLKTAEDLISKLAYGLREIQIGHPHSSEGSDATAEASFGDGIFDFNLEVEFASGANSNSCRIENRRDNGDATQETDTFSESQSQTDFAAPTSLVGWKDALSRRDSPKTISKVISKVLQCQIKPSQL